MKLVRFEYNGAVSVGALEAENILPIPGLDSLSNIVSGERIADPNSQNAVPLANVKLLAPVVPQRNVFCVGWNYLKHYEESKGKREGQEEPLPERPTLFTKLPTTIANPGDVLPLHQAYTQKLDWEVELAIVIGKAGRDISEADALSHVFGYTIANDISARDLQRAHGGQWFKGKSLDHTCPLGPVLVTADEITDPQNLDIQLTLNGEVMQSANTNRQIFPVARVIAELSAGMTLLPGDVILTGTPDGIGAARTPPRFLQDGDIVECQVEGIGTLTNRFSSAIQAVI